MKKTSFFVFGFFVITLIFLAIFPFVGIWSLNTLFNLNIDYNFKNWVAFFLLVFISKFKFSIKHK